MRARMIVVLGVAGAIGLVGCTRSVFVTVTEATRIYGSDNEDGSVHFKTNPSIDRYIATDGERAAIAIFYICGQQDRFETYSDVHRSPGGAYEAKLRPMADRTVWREDGAVVSGWPAELARQSGVCFRLHASEMMWRTLESDEVALPR